MARSRPKNSMAHPLRPETVEGCLRLIQELTEDKCFNEYRLAGPCRMDHTANWALIQAVATDATRLLERGKLR